MSKNYKYYYFSIVLIGTLLAGCNKNDDETPLDTTPPTVSNVQINGLAPGAEIVVAPGSEMDFDATFSDDRELGQYRIDIHDDFDEHNHGRIKSEPFEFNQVYNLSGTTQSVHELIDIPENAAPGPYHLTLYYFDAAGNEGEVVVIDILIADPESQPAINIISPDFDEEIEVQPGESFEIAGTITDPDGLDEVHIILGHEEHDHGRTKDEEPVYEMEYELDGAVTFNFEDAEPILIPANTPPGHYELKIIAKDVLGNTSVVMAEVHIE
jgi:hypothetical protein